MTDQNPKAHSEPVKENRLPVNQAAKALLGKEADPTTLYLLQLVEKGLDDPDLQLNQSQRRILAVQLEVLKGAPPAVAMKWLAADEVSLPKDAKEAALTAAQQLESRAAALAPGYPPPSPNAPL